MDLWLLIQIGIVAFFVLVPLGIAVFLVWVKRVVDENRELARKELELWTDGEGHYGRCNACSEPIKKGFLYCPVCHKKLGNRCPDCQRFLQLKWTRCPYCGEMYGADAVAEKKEEQLSMNIKTSPSHTS